MVRTSVMVNGLPGKMATAVAEHVLRSELSGDFELAPYSFTGADIADKACYPLGMIVELVKPDVKENYIPSLCMPDICVDFTHPSAVNSNADFYCGHNIPFVMGTTGGDRTALEGRVKDSSISAVIAPNMAKQIVALQALMEKLSNEHPNSLEGYDLKIEESHQKGKADTSGTAKAMVKYFNKLGIQFDVSQIRMIREPAEQRVIGVPEEHLGGHGWHRYTLEPKHKSDYGDISAVLDGISTFMERSPVFAEYNLSPIAVEFTQGLVRQSFNLSSPSSFSVRRNCLSGRLTLEHNVSGRSIYAVGVMDALRFLRDRKGEKGKVYSMIDVLKASERAA